MSNTVCAVRADLEVLLRDLDPDAIPLCEVPGRWKDYVAIARLGSAAATLLARQVDEGETWRAGGFKSAADQLALLSGISTTAARTQLKTSKRVRKLPKTANAMRKGELSPEKVEAIADAANVDPEAEERLVEGAEKKPLGELREDCLKAKGKDRDAAHKRIRRDRFAREYKDGEGAWNFRARGTLDAGARFRYAWERETDRQFQLARAEGRDEPREAYAFDAMIALAERCELAAGTGTNGTGPSRDEASTPTPTNTKTKAPRPPGYLVIIRIGYETLVRGWEAGEETCDIRGLGPIPVRTARELLGDATLKLVITKGVDVMNVTHIGRSTTAAQQVAMWWGGHMCSREGCPRTYRLEKDHGPEWRKTKHTRLDELDYLCDPDHDLKTNHGWDLVNGKGRRPMVPPGDPRHPNYRPPQRK